MWINQCRSSGCYLNNNTNHISVYILDDPFFCTHTSYLANNTSHISVYYTGRSLFAHTQAIWPITPATLMCTILDGPCLHTHNTWLLKVWQCSNPHVLTQNLKMYKLEFHLKQRFTFVIPFIWHQTWLT